MNKKMMIWALVMGFMVATTGLVAAGGAAEKPAATVEKPAATAPAKPAAEATKPAAAESATPAAAAKPAAKKKVEGC